MKIRNYLVLAAIVMGAMACACRGQADAKQDARSGITAVYTSIAAAMSHSALPDFEANYDPDFIQIGDDGTTELNGLSDLDGRMKPVFASRSAMHLVTKIQSITLQSPGAIVTVKQDYTYVRTKNGQPSHYYLVTTSRDFWIKQGSKWLLKRSRTLNGNLTVNGHAVPAK